ncbi:molybdenum cofactor biosynthesis protein MoaE [Roseiconus lacunae]|uniref:molybdenum cofactor biosynthesis protein MoaE n=1 Tax=Roseiconus lacunae TaxID=2605694 RepID=UPI0011F18D44|nr:molybdenum cofactor biosynthesis protein MoaE [Roseiconus lacunae]
MESSLAVLVRLVHAPIQLAQWSDQLGDPDIGAQGWFAGVTRRKTKDDAGVVRVTHTLHYEAHSTMALSELDRIATEATKRFRLTKVIVIHRLGEVPIGQVSVLVGCCSGHRPETFAALPWIMDGLKSNVPIWKRETYQDQSTEWIHP